MSNTFDAPSANLPSPVLRCKAGAWALAASLLLHILGFSSLQLSGVSGSEKPPDAEMSHVIEASLMPAQLNAAPTLALAQASAAATIDAAGFTMQAVPKPAANPVASPAENPKKQDTPKPAPLASPAPLDPPVKQIPPADSPAAAIAEPVPAPLPVASPVPPAPPPAPPLAIPEPPPVTPLLATVPASGPASAPAAAPAAAHSYRLPNQLNVKFEANVRGFSGKSVLSWKKTTEAQTVKYDAQLLSTVAIPFKIFEHRFKSSGVINALGLAPLNVEEKRPNGSTVATTVEPAHKRVIISSKEGFLPYDPQAHDLLSLMVQLAVYAQSQPQWQQAGTAQDFTVYRPSGIKRWRFQSMGLVNIELGSKMLQTVYVRRVALGAEPDFEDQHHFWLDLNRYGFPVKMRQTDSKGNHTDIQLVDWQES